MKNIFKEIVYIMQNDYAGCEDKKGWDNPEFFLTKIESLEKESKLTDETFTEVVEDYLIDFNDQHIFFTNLRAQKRGQTDVGFRVRRYEDKLYVTEVSEETRLETGIAFSSLGGLSIAELSKKHSRYLKESHPERENWNKILQRYSNGELEDKDGTASTFSFSQFEKKPYQPEYSVKNWRGTLWMTLTDFADPDAILAMVEANKTELENAESWIIDVRSNRGGSDMSFYPLLPYLMPEEGVDLAADTGADMIFNTTEANAERVQKMLAAQLDVTEAEESRIFLQIFQREWEKNKGKGFVTFDFSELLGDLFVKGMPSPRKIIVLTDDYCGSSGESFVEVCKKSSKVTVIGRPTMGLTDYGNLTCETWGESFKLWYPTSRLARTDENYLPGSGIKPHVYIPWTPEHLVRDVDAEKALELLESGHLLGN
ncbi:S41 family peptidase [Bacillus sp. B-jedd]|uniref:S41 family peptidase n=1 Tax=Bacillus sp. B-jedd TaxID=1476857 RepID=UPI000515594F|nr:S41 family peptidase [Bacillus sp. B-jedd]CEG28890.1 TSPc, tail specific protease [Bacillus sp. B-jedd]